MFITKRKPNGVLAAVSTMLWGAVLLAGVTTAVRAAPLPTLDHVALVATTQVRLDTGAYKFAAVSDDGIRLILDGKEIISRWNHHGPTPDVATQAVTGGARTIEVQYCQEDGAAALQVTWTQQP